ncbi:Uncharacterised protein [Vibrio cholerae]|nr:Uncharacterised protein [Vibrio cholerae]
MPPILLVISQWFIQLEESLKSVSSPLGLVYPLFP